MLFRRDTLKAIAGGEVTVAFRRWRRPTVRAGGTLVTPVGVLAIDSVERIALKDLAPGDARAAGHADLAGLKRELARRKDGSLYRVAFRLAGADPRIALRSKGRLSAGDLADVRAQLDRWDRASRTGPWTRDVLRRIGERPAVRAGDLAAEIGVEKAPFKAQVRKLKSLGLTESLEVGYRLSPRGRAVLRALD